MGVVCKKKGYKNINDFIFSGGMNSVCDDMYRGPLCQTCQDINNTFYSKNGGDSCEKCYSLPYQIAIILGILILYLSFFLFLLK